VKKIITIILAMTFIISMLPAVAATPAEDGGMHFIFGAAGYGESAVINKVALQTKKEAGALATVNTDQWMVAAQRYMYAINAQPTTYATYGNILELRINKTNAKGNAAIAILLKVENTGTFIPSISTLLNTGGFKFDVYLVPSTVVPQAQKNSFTVSGDGDSNIVTYLNSFTKEQQEKYMLGTVNMKGSAGESKQEFDEYTIDVACDYYLFLQTNDPDSYSDSGRAYSRLYSFDLTPVETEEPSELEKAFDYAESNHTGTGSASITAYAVYAADGEVSNTMTIENMPDVTYGEICTTIEAPEEKEIDGKNYKFLYWAKGMTMGKKQVVSYSAKIPEYKPHEGVNYLIAAYEEVGADTDTVEFYNANGQLLDLTLTEENKLPGLPSMAGYGKAQKWALRNADGTYTEYEAGADVSGRSGTLTFMAKYNDLEANIKIINNGKEEHFKYGDTVTCTSSDEDFSYWTKTVGDTTEIVSTKSTYTFNAYEACTVTAVCEGAVNLGKTMRKIILSTFAAGEETAVMAEFVGFEDALEKGIMFGNQKISMNTDKSQFTVVDDSTTATAVTGYAIVKDVDTIKKITDGEITVGTK